MRVLVVSDLHGGLAAAHSACDIVRPELILSCGDWGDPDEVTRAELAAFLKYAAGLYHVRQSRPFRNAQGTAQSGRNPGAAAARRSAGSRRSASSGNRRHLGQVACQGALCHRSRRRPGRRAGSEGRPDRHSAHARLPDRPRRHDAFRPPRRPALFLEANKTIAPRLHFCGHLHLAQERVFKDGRKVINVGATPDGSYAIVEFDAERHALEARLERLP